MLLLRAEVGEDALEAEGERVTSPLGSTIASRSVCVGGNSDADPSLRCRKDAGSQLVTTAAVATSMLTPLASWPI